MTTSTLFQRLLAAPHRGPFNGLLRFCAERRGATAVEFALVALPFLILVYGVFELGLLFLALTTLQNATDQASRLLRTGQTGQASGATQASFRNTICEQMNWMVSDCKARLVVDVKVYTSFTSGLADSQPDVVQSDPSAPGDSSKNTFHPDRARFETGNQQQIVLVRVFYPWKLLFPLKNSALVNLADGSHLLTASAAYRNEPWSL